MCTVLLPPHVNPIAVNKYVCLMFFFLVVELVCGRPVIISSLQWDQNKPTELSGIGIGLAVFSSCGYFLATRADKMPAAIWIWNVKEMRLHAVIVHKQPVTGVYLLCYNIVHKLVL